MKIVSFNINGLRARLHQLQAIIDRLPSGYRIEQAGSIEESGKASKAMLPLFPIMLAVTLIIIILQVYGLFFGEPAATTLPSTPATIQAPVHGDAGNRVPELDGARFGVDVCHGGVLHRRIQFGRQFGHALVQRIDIVGGAQAERASVGLDVV